MGRAGGLAAIIVAFYSACPSSNPAGYLISTKKTKMNKREAGIFKMKLSGFYSGPVHLHTLMASLLERHKIVAQNFSSRLLTLGDNHGIFLAFCALFLHLLTVDTCGQRKPM